MVKVKLFLFYILKHVVRDWHQNKVSITFDIDHRLLLIRYIGTLLPKAGTISRLEHRKTCSDLSRILRALCALMFIRILHGRNLNICTWRFITFKHILMCKSAHGYARVCINIFVYTTSFVAATRLSTFLRFLNGGPSNNQQVSSPLFEIMVQIGVHYNGKCTRVHHTSECTCPAMHSDVRSKFQEFTLSSTYCAPW